MVQVKKTTVTKRSNVRTVLLASCVVLVLALAGLALYLYSVKNRGPAVAAAEVTCPAGQTVDHPRSDPQWPRESALADTKNNINFTEPAQFDQGRGIWIHNGVALNNEQLNSVLKKANLNIVEFYFDYTCNFCNDFDALHREELETIAHQKNTMLVLRPVITHNGPMAIPGNEVVAWLAANRPDKVWTFEQSLTGFTTKYFTGAGLTNLSKIQSKYVDKDQVDMKVLCSDAAGGDEQAKGLLGYLEPMFAIDDALKKAGISPSQVPLPPTGVYSQAATQLFQKRYPEDSGTPKVVVNGKVLDTKLMADQQGITKAFAN